MKRENIKKQKFWKIMGFLPVMLLVLILLVYFIIKGNYKEIFLFLIFVSIFYLAVKWTEYCVKKENKYKPIDKKSYY